MYTVFICATLYSVFILNRRNDTKDFLFPGVLNTLKSLKRRGYVIGSLTNGNADVFAMDHFNGIFSFHVCASSAGAMKPQLAPFKKAFDFAKLHSLPEVIDESCVLHVGDSIHSDVIPGKLFGFKTCWVKTGDSGEDQDQSPPAEADVTCEQFAELAMVLMGPPQADEGSHL
jgi:FMN hydrolase / 5-amino-6-(5-phospho-D-ribitylamino)uracil phosphatase|eukprot:Stramenopile-MAST_4_protein_4689